MTHKLYAPVGSGPCAKAVVRAILTTPTGNTYESTNFCLSPQAVCPRKPEDGYTLCKSVCFQPGHAEENVLYAARKENVNGSTIKVFHKRICNNCNKLGREAGCTMELV